MHRKSTLKKKVTTLCLSSLLLFSIAPSVLAGQKERDKAILSSGLEDMKKLTSDLSPHQKVVKNLMLKENEKNAVLKNIDVILRKKNNTIYEYMKINKELQNKITKLSLKDRFQKEIERRKLSDKIEGHDDNINDLKNELYQKDLKIDYLKKLMKKQSITLHSKIERLNGKIKVLSNSSTGKIATNEVLVNESKNFEIIRKYQDAFASAQHSFNQFKKTTNIKLAGYDSIIKENSKLNQLLRLSTTKIADLQTDLKKMEVQYLAAKAETSRYKSIAENIKKEPLKNPKRMPASVVEMRPINIDGVVKEQIRKRISKEKIGFLADLDDNNFKIILDKKTDFISDSHSLNQEEIKSIQRIVSIYMEEIFSNEKLKNQLKRIHFIGHSSPRYNKAAVNPALPDKEAFEYNMKLSIFRANEVANAILDDSFNFKYKAEMRSLMSVSGRSFTEPIAHTGRYVASNLPKKCGEYNCKKSRRVEIVFELEKGKNEFKKIMVKN